MIDLFPALVSGAAKAAKARVIVDGDRVHVFTGQRRKVDVSSWDVTGEPTQDRGVWTIPTSDGDLKVRVTGCSPCQRRSSPVGLSRAAMLELVDG